MLDMHIPGHVLLGHTEVWIFQKRTFKHNKASKYDRRSNQITDFRHDRKRIFILHPSHHVHLSALALPTVTAYSTPLSSSPLPLDLSTIQHLSALTTVVNSRNLKFTTMSQSVDEAEHSGEMQLPYLHRLLQKLYPGSPESEYPPLVPIMVGSTNPATEAAFGKLLAPYIADPENAFVISSDFCHWGSRFGYAYYLPSSPSPALSSLSLPNGVMSSSHEAASRDLHIDPRLAQGRDLGSRDKPGHTEAAIHESIAHVDRACMCAAAAGQHAVFLKTLRDTGNTICGRHPIGVFMAGWEEVERSRQGSEASKEDDLGKGRFRFVRYERSSDVVSARDSSVSYVSAFAVL
jgi:MEMO1 family protein